MYIESSGRTVWPVNYISQLKEDLPRTQFFIDDTAIRFKDPKELLVMKVNGATLDLSTVQTLCYLTTQGTHSPAYKFISQLSEVAKIHFNITLSKKIFTYHLSHDGKQTKLSINVVVNQVVDETKDDVHQLKDDAFMFTFEILLKSTTPYSGITRSPAKSFDVTSLKHIISHEIPSNIKQQLETATALSCGHKSYDAFFHIDPNESTYRKAKKATDLGYLNYQEYLLIGMARAKP